MKRCARCGEEKPTSEFGWKDQSKRRLMSYCKPCVTANSRQHYAANKESYAIRTRRAKLRRREDRTNWLLGYFKMHPCVDCGETDPLVLDFDHLRDKEFSIGEVLQDGRWSAILAEIKKCEVVCANCHRRRTARRASHLRAVLADQR
jgi:hypothetical protein